MENPDIPDKRGRGAISGPTDGTEGVAELQVERVDRHLVAHRQDSHSGEVAGGVGDIGARRHTGQTQAGTCRTGGKAGKRRALLYLVNTHTEGGGVFMSTVPEKGPRPCCKFPRIFWPNKWISRVTTCTESKNQRQAGTRGQSDGEEGADLGIASLDVVEGSLGQLHQLRVPHSVDGRGSGLFGQGLHLRCRKV